MADKLDPNDLVSVEALALSGAWELAAVVELLERKGVCSKQEVLDMIQELRRKNPAAAPPSEPFPESYLLTQAENALIDRIFELINATGLNTHQARDLLERVTRLIEQGERIAKKTAH